MTDKTYMIKGVHKLIYVLFKILFILFSFDLSVYAEKNKDLEQIEDSLLDVLDAMPRDTNYLKKITSLEQLFIDSPKMLYYAELKEREAKKQNRIDYVCSSFSDRALYYANKGKTDSFYYWKNRMDTLALQIKNYNYYFFIGRKEVTLFLYDGKIEMGLRAARKMYDFAKKLDSVDGLIASNMSIGEAMFVAKKYDQALSSYETALSLIPSNERVRRKAWVMNIYTNLTAICKILGCNEKGLEYIDQQEKLINDIQQIEIGSNIKEPYLINEWSLLQLKKVEYYIDLNQLENAQLMLDKVKPYYSKIRKSNQRFFHLKTVDLYEAFKQWDKALSEFDIVYPFYAEDTTNIDFSLLEQRARLLGYTGGKDEALRLYQDIIIKKDSVNDKWFDSQLNELRIIYDMDHLKLKNNELELKSKRSQLQIVLISFALTILALLFISVLYIRLSRMKKKLEHSEKLLIEEKEQLVKSQYELKLAKDKAEETRDMALKVERKESFFANISHEIRTPLNAIVGFSNLLASDDDLSKEEQNLFLCVINQNCDQLLKLVNDVLDLSRMESGKLSFSIDLYNLTDIINEVYMTHQMMIPKGVDFLITVPELPVVMYTDKMRLKQVITNFISNAQKFTVTGHIRIGYEFDASSNTITLFVEDTGKGIPEEYQKKIFERFCKQDDFDKGTGLGLSISTVIAEKLGGHLTLTSEVDKGSCFAIVLPYNKDFTGKKQF